MNKHIDDSSLKKFVAGRFPIDELVKISIHISNCPTCKERLKNYSPDFVEGIDDIDLSENHLELNEVKRWLKGDIASERRLKMSDHMRNCSECKSMLYRMDNTALKQSFALSLTDEFDDEPKCNFRLIHFSLSMAALAILILIPVCFYFVDYQKPFTSDYDSAMKSEGNKGLEKVELKPLLKSGKTFEQSAKPQIYPKVSEEKTSLKKPKLIRSFGKFERTKTVVADTATNTESNNAGSYRKAVLQSSNTPTNPRPQTPIISGTSNISGSIVNQTGTVIPGANVKITNPSRGSSRSVTTDKNGNYSFPAIVPDTYKIEVTAKGFKKAFNNNVQALVDSNVTVKISLETGDSLLAIDVTTNTIESVVNTADATIGNNFVPEQITELPSNLKRINDLLVLQPGVTRNGYVAGGRMNSDNITLSGVDINSDKSSTNKRTANQSKELMAISNAARSGAKAVRDSPDAATARVNATNLRISSGNDYVVQSTQTINFRIGSSKLSSEAKQQLNKVATTALTLRGYVLEVKGFASSDGNVSANKRLSEQRAKAVIDYLIMTHNIPLRRIGQSYGYGGTQAIIDNSTLKGKYKNHRVEIKLIVNRELNLNFEK